VTMGMPALVYRWFFRAHSLKSLKRNVLSFTGIKPIRTTLIGNIEGLPDQQRMSRLDEIRGLGLLGK
jgi:putative NADPH-quinone reductase